MLTDLLSKKFARKKLKLNEKVEIIKNRLYLFHIKNTGVAFNFLSGRKRLILSLNAGIILYMLLLIRRFKAPWAKLSFSLALGGALGNMIDRIKNGSVTDFIYFKFKKAPVFNISDFFVIIGGLASAVVLLINMEQ